VKPGARAEDDDGEAGAADVWLTSTTRAEDDGGVTAGEQLDIVFTAADDAQADEDGAEARPLPRHLPKMTATWPPASSMTSSSLLRMTPKLTTTARRRVHFHDI
jgi:hypothetical protein